MNIHTSVMAGYFRSWRDIANGTPGNTTSMAELPEELDIAFVFPDGTETQPAFWAALGERLIPAMHAKGIKVIRTVAIEELIKPGNPTDIAEHILTTFLYSTAGLDGLDIDIERTLLDTERQAALDVSRIIAKRLKAEGKLWVYDTTEHGDVELLKALHEDLDYLLFQAYGQSPGAVQGHYDRMFSTFLPIGKFLVGFSFYEERGARWGDTVPDFDNSTALAYANWLPTQGPKAGLFAYAVDRDGVPEGADELLPTDYSWTKRLKAQLRQARR